MDLEKLNQEYVKLKKDLETAQADSNALEKQIGDLNDDKKIQNAESVKAKRSGDKAAEQKASDEIKKIDEKIEAIKQISLEKKSNVQELQAKIESRIKELRENPEMVEHLNTVLSKKYDRKLTKLKNEKQELVDKKDRFTTLQNLVQNNPGLSNNLKDILTHTKQIKDLQTELKNMKLSEDKPLAYSKPARATIIMSEIEALETELEGLKVHGGSKPYSDPARAKKIKSKLPQLKSELKGMERKSNDPLAYSNPTRATEIMSTLLPQAQDKLNNSKKTFMNYIPKDISKDFSKNKFNTILDEMSEFVTDEKGNIDLNNTMTKNASSINRKIKRIDKSIGNYTRALGTVDYYLSESQPTNPGTKAPGTKKPGTTAPGATVDPEDKPKWYQRFLNWKNKRKQKALPEAGETVDPEDKPKWYQRFLNWKNKNKDIDLVPPDLSDDKEPKDNGSIFRNSLKYDIVKDLVEEFEKEDLSAAKKAAKEAASKPDDIELTAKTEEEMEEEGLDL